MNIECPGTSIANRALRPADPGLVISLLTGHGADTRIALLRCNDDGRVDRVAI
jgi:hypothetical protein